MINFKKTVVVIAMCLPIALLVSGCGGTEEAPPAKTAIEAQPSTAPADPAIEQKAAEQAEKNKAISEGMAKMNEGKGPGK